MADVPTYQDINRARAEADANKMQMAQREAVAKEAQSISTPNPVLAEYMGRSQQQGLVPREVNAGDYTSIATQVANTVPNQEEYSKAMIGAVTSGVVSPEAVLSDESILPQYREGLLNSLKQSSGLGQLR